MTGLKRFILFASTSGLGFAAAPAMAQQAPAQAVQDDVVVTAQKREQRLQDVPMSVTALTASSLIENNQVKVEDYFRLVPGLQLSPLAAGRYNLSIRGVTTGIGTSPTVGITIDDVPYGSVSIAGFGSRFFPNLDPSDLQRIEVLRGPQGTLYGASSLGGLLKYVTLDPSFARVSGRVQADLSTIEKGGTGGGGRAAINVPLVDDKLAIRASGFYRHDGGYVDDPGQHRTDVDRANVYGGRLALLWKIAPGASLKLGALYQHDAGDGTNQVDTNYLLNETTGDLQHRAQVGTGPYLNSSQFYTGHLKVVLGGGIGLDAVSGYSVNVYRTVADTTPSFGGAAAFLYGLNGSAMPYGFRTAKFSQELRLSSSGTSVDWLVGGFYTNEKSTDYFIASAADPVTGSRSGVFFDEADQFHYKEYAAFGDVTVHVTSQLDLQAGARYSSNKQRYHSLTAIPLAVQPFLGPTTDFSQNSSDNAFTFEVGPSFKLSRNLLLYGRVSSGYRPGGPNAGDFDASTPRVYKADRTTNYEVGVKGSVGGRTLTFEVAAFMLDWNDIQLAFHDQVTGFLFLKNGSKATSKGVEGSFELRPTHGLSISGNASYNEAKLAADLPGPGSIGRDGDVLPNVPKFSGTLSAEQSFPVFGHLEGFVGGSISHVSSRRAEFANSAAEIRVAMPGYTKGDLRFGVRGDGLTVTAFVSNVGNSRGVLYGGALGSHTLVTDPFYKLVLQPRTFGITASREF
jgi:outer membrane receptor protein involved in Fe transport